MSEHCIVSLGRSLCTLMGRSSALAYVLLYFCKYLSPLRCLPHFSCVHVCGFHLGSWEGLN
eukprot:jgi/Botrbrau1/14896/Bobra.0018s0001.1